MSVDLEKLCLGCMRELPKGAHECLRCGWKKGGKNAPHQLPAGTLLGGKYYVGAALHEDQNGITYIAYDINAGARLEVVEYYPQATATRLEGGYNVSTMTGDESALVCLNALPKRRETFLENGTAYAVTPLDLEEEKKRQDAFEAEREKVEKRERRRRRFKIVYVLLLLVCLAALFVHVQQGVGATRWYVLDHRFDAGYARGTDDLGSIVFRYGLNAAKFILIFSFLIMAFVNAIAALRGKPRAKIWWTLGVCVLCGAAYVLLRLSFFDQVTGFDYVCVFVMLAVLLLFLMTGVRGRVRPAGVVCVVLGGVIVSCAVVICGILVCQDLTLPSLLAEGETYTGERMLLAREVEDEPYDQIAYQYDGQGRVVQEIRWQSTLPRDARRTRPLDYWLKDPFGWIRHTYAYNEQGDVIREEIWTNDDPEPEVMEYEYTYDGEGRLDTKTSSDGESWHYTYSVEDWYDYSIFEQVEGGLLLKREYDANGKLLHEDRYYSNKDGSLDSMVSCAVSEEDGEPKYTDEYRENYEDGRLAETIEYGKTGKISRDVEYNYDGSGRLSGLTYISGSYSWDSHFDEKGLLFEGGNYYWRP